MKTKEELNALKEEVKDVSRKLHELTDDDLAQVSGGLVPDIYYNPVLEAPVLEAHALEAHAPEASVFEAPVFEARPSIISLELNSHSIYNSGTGTADSLRNSVEVNMQRHRGG